MKLIAKTTVAAHIGGKRAEFAPGSALPPDLPERDAQELLRMGAAEERGDSAAANPAAPTAKNAAHAPDKKR